MKLRTILNELMDKNTTQEQKNKFYEYIKTIRVETKNANAQFDKFGLNLLHWATLCNQHDEMIQLIDKEKIDVNQGTDRLDVPPISMAAAYGDLTTVQILLDRKANISNTPGHEHADTIMTVTHAFATTAKSPYKIAKDSGRLDVVKLFEKPLLNQYIHDRSADRNQYKTSFTLFGHTFHFGYSKDEKLSAANELKKLLDAGSDFKTLNNFKKSNPAVNQGDLGDIYQTSLKARR